MDRVEFINTKRIFPNLRFGVEGLCSYCGEAAEADDHVIPYSVIDTRNVKRKKTEPNKGLVTPVCSFCNGHLGSRVFSTWTDRIGFLRKIFAKKSKKYRKAGSWTEDELNEIDYTLRTEIIRGIREMERLDRQSIWESSLAYKRVFLSVEESGGFLDNQSPYYESLHYFFDNL